MDASCPVRSGCPVVIGFVNLPVLQRIRGVLGSTALANCRGFVIPRLISPFICVARLSLRSRVGSMVPCVQRKLFFSPNLLLRVRHGAPVMRPLIHSDASKIRSDELMLMSFRIQMLLCCLDQADLGLETRFARYMVMPPNSVGGTR